MSGKYVVYASDLKIPESIMAFIDGSSDIYIENPWHTAPGVAKVDSKDYMSRLQLQTKNCIIYKSPAIYLKPPNGIFTKNWVLGYGQKGVKKQYRINSPFEPRPEKFEKDKQNIRVNPIEVKTEDTNTSIFETRVLQTLEILVTAWFNDINMTKFDKQYDNKVLMDNFSKEVTNYIRSKQDVENDFKYDAKLLQSFINPPYYYKQGNKTVALAEFAKPKSVIKNLLSSFIEYVLEEDVGTLYKQHIDIFKENTKFMPAFRKVDYLKKNTTDHKEIFEAKLTFMIETPNTKNQYLITDQMLNNKKTVKMNAQSLIQLWGAKMEDLATSKTSIQEGVIFLHPQIQFRLFSQGNPGIDWRVDKIVTKPVTLSSASTYDDGADLLSDDETETGKYFNDVGPTMNSEHGSDADYA